MAVVAVLVSSGFGTLIALFGLAFGLTLSSAFSLYLGVAAVGTACLIAIGCIQQTLVSRACCNAENSCPRANDLQYEGSY